MGRKKDRKQSNKLKSSVYCHSDCKLWKVDGCCAWITFKKKDVKTAEGYEKHNTKEEFFDKVCMFCENYLIKSDDRLKKLGVERAKSVREKERQERLIEGLEECIEYNQGRKK